MIASLPPLLYEPLIRRALEEDLGRAGDLTSDAILPPDLKAEAAVVARKAGRIAGLEAATSAFRILDPTLRVELRSADGRDAAAGEVLAVVRGTARSILTAERTALNLLGRLCGVATATRDLVALVAPHGTRIVCTRKTTPGLRALEKYAVRAGGGSNHRFGLDDAVLIKDNHVRLAGGVEAAVARCRTMRPGLRIEVEAQTLEEVDAAVRARADIVLVDNMSLDDIRDAVRRARGVCQVEISGGVTLDRIDELASTGADFVSAGALTHSAPAVDISFEIEPDRSAS